MILALDHGDGGGGTAADRGGGGGKLWAAASLQTGGMHKAETNSSNVIRTSVARRCKWCQMLRVCFK